VPSRLISNTPSSTTNMLCADPPAFTTRSPSPRRGDHRALADGEPLGGDSARNGSSWYGSISDVAAGRVFASTMYVPRRPGSEVVTSVRVLVSGGGIAGLAAATALTQQGIDVDLVERSTSWRTNGAGISLYPNGERVLRDLGLVDAVVDAGQRIETLRVMDAAGVSAGEFPFERWPGVGGVIAIHRDALQEVLVRAAYRARISLGSSVARIDDTGSGVSVTFGDGSQADYSVVIVAEGIRSTTRAAVFGAFQPRPVGQMYWRTAVPEAVVDMLTMIAGKDRFVSLVPLGHGQTYIAVQTRSAPVEIEPDERIATMRSVCTGLGGPVPGALDAVRSDDDVFVGPAEEVVEICWRRSRVVLIGDASHALSPSFAQGANLALEDAYVLADELAAAGDVDAALDSFVRRREPRVAFVQEKTTERIALVNSGAGQQDLYAASQLVSAHLSAPI
jgi:2-polyprenyl-6-methoxyphenol hydroxylase-like FAD-dependent oxidoreductase